MQNVAWPRTIVQNEKEMSAKLKAERSAMPVTIPGRAIGSTKRSEIASRPKNFARASAAAASVPRTMASAVDTSATRMERPSAAQISGRFQATPNQRSVYPGGGNSKLRSSLLNAYRMMKASGRCRSARPPAAPSRKPSGGPSFDGRSRLERIERPGAFRYRQEHAHDDHRRDGEGRRERDVSGRALLRVNHLAQDERRRANNLGHDVVAEREREGEDRPRHNPRSRKRQDHMAERLRRLGAEVPGRLDERDWHTLERRLHRKHHERRPQVKEHQHHAGVADRE